MLEDNIKKDSFISFCLDFLLNDKFFLKSNLSEFLFILGNFKSVILKITLYNQSLKNNFFYSNLFVD